MTESVWFEADDDRYRELAVLSEELAAGEQELLNEALDLLLAAYRGRTGLASPVGLLSDLHDVQCRFRAMVHELELIRCTTAGITSGLAELGVSGTAFDALRRHYGSIFESSERALKAAGVRPFFKDADAA